MPPPTPDRRERHKDERRARIIAAAHDLLREAGADDLSVKMIADRADVSAATVYNLFGAKGAVLAKVYRSDFEAFAKRFTETASPQALEAMFDAIRIATDLYRTDPGFYRGMSIRNPRAEPALVMSVQEPRLGFWRALLDRAVKEGDLRRDTRTDLLAQAILQLGDGAFAYWCADLIEVDEIQLHTEYSVSRLLLGLASPSARARLQARVDEIESVTRDPREPKAVRA